GADRPLLAAQQVLAFLRLVRQGRDQARPDLWKQLVEQILAAVEVLVERAERHPGAPGDLGDRRALEAVFADDVGGGVDERAAVLARPLFPRARLAARAACRSLCLRLARAHSCRRWTAWIWR